MKNNKRAFLQDFNKLNFQVLACVNGILHEYHGLMLVDSSLKCQIYSISIDL